MSVTAGIVILVFLIVAGCTANNYVTAPQVIPAENGKICVVDRYANIECIDPKDT